MVNNENMFFDTANSEELPINAMARVVIQLGEQLIENEVVALLEIIKNSYDADAKNVFIEIDTTTSTNLGQGYIRVVDNGNGMNKEQIKTGFLMISTINKSEKGRSARHQRIPLGEKGVGRLSTQRLASYLNLRTKSWNKDTEYLLSINWSKFNENVILGNISAFLNTRDFDYNLFEEKDYIHDDSYIPKQITERKFGFTELNLIGLNNIEFWNEKEIDKVLGNQVLRLVSPFRKNDSVDITISLTNEYYKNKIIKTEAIDEEFLEESAMYKVDFNFDYPVLKIECSFSPMFYKKLEGKEPRNNLPSRYETNHIVIDTPIVFNILQDNDRLKKQLKKTIVNNSIDFADPGKFKGKFFIYNYALEQQLNEFYSTVASNFSSLFQNEKDVKEFLKSNAGVKVYRDRFRVLPYGSNENDWLGLTKLSQSSGSFFGPKVANTIGYVELNSYDNRDLKEMTNRQGFILDPFGENFLAICREIAALVSREVRRQTDEFSHRYPKTTSVNAHEEADDLITKTSNDVSEVLGEAKRIANKLSEKINNTQPSLFEIEENDKIINHTGETLNKLVEKTLSITSNLQRASDEIKAAKKMYEYSKEEVAPLLELSALGIIAEALTHELHKSITNTRFRAQKIQEIAKQGLEEQNNSSSATLFKKTHGEARLIEADSNSIDRQVRHLSPGFRQRRKSLEKVNVNKELKHIYLNGVMTDRAAKNGIRVNIIEDGQLSIKATLGLLIQVFDNLFINSEYWIQYYFNNNYISQKEFNIHVNSNGLVRIWDSGLGIDPTIENRIFIPFETQKQEGRGLGLYIVNSILEFNNSTIRLLSEKNIHNRKFMFEIDFSKIIV